MLSLEDQIKSVEKVLRDINSEQAWGRLTLNVISGNVVEMNFSQTMKPEKILSGEKIVCPRK